MRFKASCKLATLSSAATTEETQKGLAFSLASKLILAPSRASDVAISSFFNDKRAFWACNDDSSNF